MDAERAPDPDRRFATLWGGERPPRRGPKPTLSVEEITRAGIQLADAEGLSALSMSRVARHLNSPVMSLYRYLPSRTELVDVMLDTVIGPPPDLSRITGGWRPRLAHWTTETERIFLEHPWALPLVTTSRVVGPNELGWLESALGALSGVGLDEAEMLDAVLLVNSYARGNAQAGRDTNGPEWLPRHDQIVGQDPIRRRYPTVARLLGGDSGAVVRTDTSFGLHRVLDGLQAFIDDRRGGPPST